MIGNAITDFTREAAGTYGYVVVADLGELLIEAAKWVLLQKDGVLSGVVDTPSSFTQLMAYPESAACPDVAWTQAGTRVYVFAKTADYPYDAGVSVAFGFRKFFTPVTATGDEIGIPASGEGLYDALVLVEARGVAGIRAGFDVDERVRREKGKLGLS